MIGQRINDKRLSGMRNEDLEAIFENDRGGMIDFRQCLAVFLKKKTH